MVTDNLPVETDLHQAIAGKDMKQEQIHTPEIRTHARLKTGTFLHLECMFLLTAPPPRCPDK